MGKFQPPCMQAITRTIQAGQTETVADVEAAKPHWNKLVVAAKVWGQSQVDPEAITQTIMRNGSVDLRAETASLAIPSLVIAGDPKQGGIFDGLGDQQNHVSCICLEGTGHNPHRDKLGAVLECLFRWYQDLRSE